MLKLVTVLDNPGEPFAQTRYRDPRHLASLGYNGLVIYETTGLSGVSSPDALGTGEIGRWVAQQFEQLAQRITQAKAAGLRVLILYDTLSLARNVVARQVSQLTCRNRPNMLCPASENAVSLSVDSLEKLLQQLPAVDGVVLRFGDNDASRLPYLMGNDIYTPHCPRCSQLGRMDRIVTLIHAFYSLVVTKLDKQLIVRAWNVRPNGMHDSVELCERVCTRLPGDEDDQRLVLSFKFTQTDFWRYQKWNPSSLRCGRRPVIYELQCQREFEGKGGIPNWQVPLWCDGLPEMSEAEGEAPSGLRQVSEMVNLAGLWSWARGGGWGGPFVSKETWIDANVFAVPRLVDQPGASPATLADEWITHHFGELTPALRGAITQALADSPQYVLQGFYLEPYARSKTDAWHPNADWIQDDLLDAQAVWRIIQKLPDSSLDVIIEEKQAAVNRVMASQEQLTLAADAEHRQLVEPLINSLIYTESLFMTLRDLLTGLVAYRRYLKGREVHQADLCRSKLMAAQSHWTHHTQRHGTLPGTATCFRENHFWDLTQKILSELP